jgi:hypothetical protein
MNELLIPIVAILMPVVLVPTILILRHISKKREWEHLERIKSMELGMPVPGNESWPAKVCIAIGAGVPIVAFFFAFVASQDSEAGGGVWAAATMVGVSGVLSGSVLATRLLPSRRGRPHPDVAAKPAYDPDAYDVVSSRG